MVLVNEARHPLPFAMHCRTSGRHADATHRIESPMHGPWPSNSRPDKRPRETFISFKVKNEQSNDEERRLAIRIYMYCIFVPVGEREAVGMLRLHPSDVASVWAAAGVVLSFSACYVA